MVGRTSKTSDLGLNAEQLALKFLEKNNLQCIKKNYYTRLGEIDLIVTNEQLLVFVEVRLRTHKQVSALESVDSKKQKKIIKAAQYFLLQNKKYRNYQCRFDVIAMNRLSMDSIVWIQDAFQLQE